ncbi:MAG: stage II sporulation protein P [Candidatus Spyradocola sp.]|jgi:stage II sporulation protein P
MIRIKVYTLSQVIGAAVLAVLLIVAIVVGIRVFAGAKESSAIDQGSETLSYVGDAASAADPEADKPESAVSWLLPDEEAIPVTADGETEDLPDDVDRIRVEISKIEGEFEAEPKEKPRVLLYHTHSYEAFAQDPDNPYEETTQWRSADPNFNIMAVGAKLKEELEARGIEVVHDLTEHEPPKLGTAYIRSLETLEGYTEAGEEFDMILDIHRDAASARNTNPSCVTANGKQYARLMMLIGTGEGDDGEGFSIKPNWQENYKLAEALTEGLNERIPGICRDIMVKTGRYNQHMSERAVLVEVGHNENTLQEALNATEPLADVIADLLLDPESTFAS